MKKIIYDFDGTITKNGVPIYGFFEKCNIPTDTNSFMNLVKNEIIKNKYNTFEAFYKVLFDYIRKAGLPLNNNTFCIGVEKIEYNPGVIEFLKEQNSKIENYILTSGYNEYISKTAIAPYIKNIYGTSYEFVNNEAIGIKELVTDEIKIKKIDIIANGDYSNIVYIGDGLTDIPAFKYVIEKGGISILVHQPENNEIYNTIINKGINVKCFEADYRKNSKLYNFLNQL